MTPTSTRPQHQPTRHRRHRWAAPGLLLAATLATSLLGSCTSEVDRPEASEPRLDDALQALVEREGGPVGVVVTIDGGAGAEVVSAGTAEVDTEEPPGAEHHVRIASLSKAMTAATALVLVDDGELSLEDTVGERLPDLPAQWHDVTLRQLLGHTSGVPDFSQQPAFGDAVGRSPTVAPSPREILEVAGTTLDHEPGESFEYSNSNPFLTALMVEQATGRDFADVLAERVLEPLGMTDTHLPAADDPDVPEPTLHGYVTDADGSVEDVTGEVSFGGWAWSSGGIVSTPSDLRRFVRGYVGGGLFGDRTRTAQHRFVEPGSSEPTGPGDNAAGLGLFRYRTPCGTVVGHTGSILGYTQFIAASDDGTRSVTFTISTQVGDELLEELRAAQELAVCEALG